MGVSVVAKYTMKVYFYIRVSVSFPLRLKLDSIALEQLDTCTRGLGLYITIINIIYWHEWTQDDFYARRNIFSSMRIMGGRSLAVDSGLCALRDREIHGFLPRELSVGMAASTKLIIQLFIRFLLAFGRLFTSNLGRATQENAKPKPIEIE